MHGRAESASVQADKPVACVWKKKTKNCRSTALKNKECTQLFIIVPVDLLQNKV